MTPIVFPKVPEKGASDEEWTKYDKNLQDVITRYINDAIKKASDDSAVVLSSIPAIASSAQAISGVDNSCIITPLRLRDGLNATGEAPIYACRAWVNFNGTGTVAIRASGNVSSITDNGMGDYTVNFTTAMSDANYSYCGTAGRNSASAGFNSGGFTVTPNDIITARTSSSFRFVILSNGGDGYYDSVVDSLNININVFR